MRCPKCGYNSFDHLDSCKKCGKALLEFKQRYGIKSVLFPGQMKPNMTAGEEFENSAVAAAAVAVASAGGVVAGLASEAGSAEAPASEADDFGFDFMGESEEEEDLSFDELFEEAPVDEDVEETLPSPEPAAKAEAEDVAEFSFDSAAEDAAEVASDSDLDSDFGFDLDSATKESGTGPAEDLASDDFDLPPVEEDDFDFNPDDIEFGETAEDAEKEGTPKDPFDLPEFSQDEEAPEQVRNIINDQPLPIAEEETALLLAEPEVEIPAVTEIRVPVAEEQLSSIGAPMVAVDALQLTEVIASPDVAFAEVPAQAEASIAEVPAEETASAVVGSLTEDEEPATLSSYSLQPPVVSRIAAFFTDLVLLSMVAVSFIVAAETAMSGSSGRLLPSLTTLIDLSIPYFLVLFFLAFGYFTLFHFLVGQTPGKMLVGLRVETLDGEPLGLSQAFLRSVGGLLQLLPGGLGYLVALLSPDRRGWNDRLAGTRLIALKAGLNV